MQKHLLLLLAGSIISAILHNFISGLLKTEEPLFFILTFIFFFSFVVSLIHNVISYFRNLNAEKERSKIKDS